MWIGGLTLPDLITSAMYRADRRRNPPPIHRPVFTSRQTARALRHGNGSLPPGWSVLVPSCAAS
jgi:hypothetical protein